MNSHLCPVFLSGHLISFSKSQLHYAKGGNGPDALLLFHGFGQDLHAFDAWVGPLGTRYTLYSFDLFFHGRSEWNEDHPLEKSEWALMISKFLERENITRFAVAGYSLGGKFELAAAEAFPEKILHLIFIAPDGVKINFWYRLATGSHLLRRLFKSMIGHPERFQNVVRLLRRLQLVHNGILRFAESQMDTEEKRRRVYETWITFRVLHFSNRRMVRLLARHAVATTFIAGSHDKMIPHKSIVALSSRLKNSDLVLLDAGHNDVLRAALNYLINGSSGDPR